jgi:hypothetical protein
MSYHVSFSFSPFISFLAIFQVLQCKFLNFLVGQVSRHIPGPIVCISHFARFSEFLTIFQVKQCLCLIFHEFKFSCHIPGPTVCVCLILHVFQFSLYNPGPTMCISHISRISVFPAILQVLQYVFLILHDFQCFLPHFKSYHVSFSFSLFVSFIGNFQVIQCLFLIFHVCQFSRHDPGPTVCILHIFVFTNSCHIPGSTVCICLFPRFSVFFIPIFQVLQLSFSFCTFFTFLDIFQFLQ